MLLEAKTLLHGHGGKEPEEDILEDGDTLFFVLSYLFSRLPRTTIQDLARFGARCLSRLMVIAHMEGRALGTLLGRRRRQ